MTAAKKKDDPTVTSDAASPEWPEGTHPAREASEVTDSAVNIKYADLPADQKPDPSTIAQYEVKDDEPA